MKLFHKNKQISSGVTIYEGGYQAGVQADWSQKDSTKMDFIKNKPEIPEQPDLSKYAKKNELPEVNNGALTVIAEDDNTGVQFSANSSDNKTLKFTGALGVHVVGKQDEIQILKDSYFEVIEKTLFCTDKYNTSYYIYHLENTVYKTQYTYCDIKLVGFNNTIANPSKLSLKYTEPIANGYIRMVEISSSVGAYSFEIIIKDENGERKYPLILLFDTGSRGICFIITELKWDFEIKTATHNSNDTWVYLKKPDDFIGEIHITPLLRRGNYTLYFSTNQTYTWVAGSMVEQTNYVVNLEGKEPLSTQRVGVAKVDFVDSFGALQIGDKFNNDLIFNKLIHDLLFAVREIKECNCNGCSGDGNTGTPADIDLSDYIKKDDLDTILEEYVKRTKYTVIWKDGDGSVLDTKTYFADQLEPTTDKTPTKAETTSHTFTFANWSKTQADKTTTYTPNFTEVEKTKYTVTYKDEDGTVLQSTTYYEGQTPPSAPANPTKPETVSHTYTFNQWLGQQTDPYTTIYTAQYTATEKTLYTVVWKNGSTTLQTKTYYEGQSEPLYSGSITPTKSSYTSGNYTYSYTFKGWDNGSWSGNTKTYTAQFNKSSTYNGSSSGGSSGGGCFVAGTLVQTPKGLRPIEDIKIGDKVITFNLSKRVNEPDEVRLVWSGIKDFAMYHISVGNAVISATWNHKMYIKRNGEINWLTAEELQMGDMMFNINHEWIPITAIVQDTQEIVVYDFGCKTNHNFYITTGGYLVHNLEQKRNVDNTFNPNDRIY